MSETLENVGIRTRVVALAAAGAFGAAALVGCSGGEDNESERTTLDVSASEFQNMCDEPAMDLGAVRAEIQAGPFESNDKADAKNVENKAVITELFTELPANTMGIAILSEAIKLQDGDYKVADFKGTAEETFRNIAASDEAREDACLTVAETLAAKAEVHELKASEIVRFTNNYNGGILVGLNAEKGNPQDTITVVTVRDKNGAVRWGVVTDEARDGEFVMVVEDQKDNQSKNDQEQGGPSQEGDQTGSDQAEAENGGGGSGTDSGENAGGNGGTGGGENGDCGGGCNGGGGDGGGGCDSCGGGDNPGPGQPTNPGPGQPTNPGPGEPTEPGQPTNPGTPTNPPTHTPPTHTPPTQPPSSPPTQTPPPPTETPKGEDPGCPPGAPCE